MWDRSQFCEYENYRTGTHAIYMRPTIYCRARHAKQAAFTQPHAFAYVANAARSRRTIPARRCRRSTGMLSNASTCAA